jgi:hypothetical protein
MSRGLGKIQQTVLRGIEAHGEAWPRLSTQDLARKAYDLSPGAEISDPQLVATRRALRGLQKKLLIFSHGRQGLGFEQWSPMGEMLRNQIRYGIYARDRDLSVELAPDESLTSRAARHLQQHTGLVPPKSG